MRIVCLTYDLCGDTRIEVVHDFDQHTVVLAIQDEPWFWYGTNEDGDLVETTHYYDIDTPEGLKYFLNSLPE